MKRDIQAVFFDAGYTLLCMEPEQPALFARVCSDLGIALDQSRFALGMQRAEALRLLGTCNPGKTPTPFSQEAIDRFWIDYNRLILAACARSPQDADKAETVYRLFTASITWKVYAEVEHVLAHLRARGLRLGVISNWGGDLEDIFRRIGLHNAFDFVLDSARLGYEKPHAPIFEEAVRRAGVRPSASVHVGDSPEHDVDGALASGLEAVLLDRFGRHQDFTRAPRIETLAGLLELAELRA